MAEASRPAENKYLFISYGVNKINIYLFRYGVMSNTNLVILEMFVLMPLLPCPIQDGTGQEWLV